MSETAERTPLARVLVADDDADILGLVRRRLERRGYVVITASDGHTALELSIAERPDAVILDGVMPGLEGHEVCAAMRAREETAAIPVIVLTAKAAEIDERRALSAGASAYMLKPFAIEDLDRTLRELLELPPSKR